MNESSLSKLLEEQGSVKINELWEVMEVAREAKLTLLVRGMPGVGKSEIARQFAAAHAPNAEAQAALVKQGDAERDHLLYHETRFSYAAPTDVRGWPTLGTDDQGRQRMLFAPPIDYPMSPGCFWHLEELLCASSETLKAGLQLLLEGRIGEYECPPDTFIMGSGNRIEDYADVEDLAAPVADRLMIVTLELCLESWLTWAMEPKNNIDARLPAFLYFFPHLLHNMPVNGENSHEDWDGKSQFATPRSWAFVSRFLKAGGEELSARPRMAGLKGLVGTAATTQLELFLQAEKTLPDREELVRHPSRAKIPEGMAACACVCQGIAASMNADNCKAYMTYLNRLAKELGKNGKNGEEFLASALQWAHKSNSDVLTYPDFIDVIMERPGLFNGYEAFKKAV